MRRWLLLFTVGFLWWNTAADAQIKRPLVFIPGILGTRLCDEQNNLIWGGLSSLSNFGQIDLLADQPRNLHKCGLIKTIVSLGPFWQADIYTPLLTHLGTIGYHEGTNLIIFDYDWRQSNETTADDLAAFLTNHKDLQNRDFDILAHSMGGLVARLLVKRHSAMTSSIKRIITMGTSFQGTGRALEVVAKGWGPIPNFLAGRMKTIRRTALSFPSLYELFPSYKFGRDCCRLGSLGQTEASNFDIFDFSLWEKNGWVAEIYDTAQGREYLRANLTRARSIRAEIEDRASVSPPELHFVGTKRDTPFYVYVNPNASSLDHWEFAVGPGDSVVPAWSAADAFSDSLAGSRPAFPAHATIFTDENLQETLKLELTESPAPRKKNEAIIQTSEGGKTLSGVAVDVDRYFVGQSGDSVIVRVTLRLGERLGRATVSLTAIQADAGMTAIPLLDVTSDNQRDSDTFVAEGTLKITGQPSVKRVDVDIPGVGIQSSYVEIVQ
jgi:pimeloyl-ACP methyl ester carboxylesterase